MPKYKELQIIIAMSMIAKVMEIFCIADSFYIFFDTMIVKDTIKPKRYKGRNHINIQIKG
uniref:Transposase n=5 Tax=unclassified Prevotella TaxID=2638335 RepID=A0AB33JQL8_9BACT